MRLSNPIFKARGFIILLSGLGFLMVLGAPSLAAGGHFFLYGLLSDMPSDAGAFVRASGISLGGVPQMLRNLSGSFTCSSILHGDSAPAHFSRDAQVLGRGCNGPTPNGCRAHGCWSLEQRAS